LTTGKLEIPEIPWGLVDEARRRTNKVWKRADLDLQEPALSIGWDRHDEKHDGASSMSYYCQSQVSRMIDDPEADLASQLTGIRHWIEHLQAGEEIGIPVSNAYGLHLLHFGTGPLATAFGAKMIVRDDEQPFFEPAVHTPEEVMCLTKPDLQRDGICPIILDRIDYFTEATEGRIPLNICDTAGPWSIATQIWHYEDMLEAIHTAPAAVHYLLDLVTSCIREWNDIQTSRMQCWSQSNTTVPNVWIPDAYYLGDDCMVAVSPSVWEEFFLPYNNRISLAYGGLLYHCCMNHDFQFESMAKTEGFVGLDADPAWNEFDKIVETLSGRGVWGRTIGDAPTDSDSETPLDIGKIRRLKGKAGMFLGVQGRDRKDATDRAKQLLDSI
jgi:hypothetical protein